MIDHKALINPPETKQGPGLVLATVMSVETDGLVLRFDGEAAAGQKRYKQVESYNTVEAGQRVVVAQIGGSGLVLGAIGDPSGGGGGSTDGWIPVTDAWAFASATGIFATMTVPDGTKFRKGMALKLTQTTVKYFYVTGIAGNTLTITGGKDYTLVSAAITNSYYSLVKPVDFPNWFNYTPAYSCSGSMTYTGVSVPYATFMMDGDTATVAVGLSGTLGGTASTTINVSSPFTPYYASVTPVPGYGWIFENSIRIAPCARVDATNGIEVRKYDSSNWILGAGRSFGVGATFKIV